MEKETRKTKHKYYGELVFCDFNEFDGFRNGETERCVPSIRGNLYKYGEHGSRRVMFKCKMNAIFAIARALNKLSPKEIERFDFAVVRTDTTYYEK